MPSPIPQLDWRDPATLRPHPATKHLYSMPDADPRYVLIVDSMQNSGFSPDKPVTIDATGRILDGRHRWRAAKQLQLPSIPCVVMAEEDAATIIVNSINARKHFTKGARAFELYPFFEAAHEEARRRYLENLKKGPQPPVHNSVGDGKTVEGFAQQIGISIELFRQAAEVHKLFKSDPEYAAQMLPRIFGEPIGGEHEENRPVGLGAVLAGHSGQQTTREKERPPTRHYTLFTKAFAALGKRAECWNELAHEQRRTALEQIREHTAAMPADLLREWQTIIRSTLKEKETT